MSTEAKPCPCCGGPASAECAMTWTVRCALSCPDAPETEALQKSTAILWWNRLVDEFESEVA